MAGLFIGYGSFLYFFYRYALQVLLNWIFFTKKNPLTITEIENLLYICCIFVMCSLQNE